jgi:polyphosphate kinase 2 (PPK2 family)
MREPFGGIPAERLPRWCVPHPPEVSDMANKKDNDAKAPAPSAGSVQGAGAEPPPKMKRKEYEREMRVLQGELVAMQEWVKASGAKICIVFEGRDTAGKGGTIKRITERVSPRVFRVVALPAPTERENSQMHIQRYLPHFPAAGEVVIFERVQPGGRRAGDGLLHARGDRAVPRTGAGGRESHGR